jgi:hypothetical protein
MRLFIVLAIVLLVTVAIWTIFTLQADIEKRYGTFQEVPLRAPSAVIARFTGDWYQDRLLLKARIREGSQPTLAVRFDRSCQVVSARAEGDGLLFNYSCSKSNGEIGLTFTDSERVLWASPGEPTWCGTCTPRLSREGAWSRAGRWAQVLAEVTGSRVRKGVDAVELWAVRTF